VRPAYAVEYWLYASAFAYVFNPATYNRMSKAQQKVIDEHCTNEWALRVASGWADYERAGLPKLQADSAHEVYPLTAEQLAATFKKLRPGSG
jgi:TRAP-type C4-dicarboxylate transport system substrate-binding protein